jgi:hypothetical protein
MSMRFVTLSRFDCPGWQITLESLFEVGGFVTLRAVVADAQRP